jgi:hypothetical protein
LNHVLSRAAREDAVKEYFASGSFKFHPLVTKGIDRLDYRHHNYRLAMSLSTQLARWLNKQLVLKYTFASLMTPFEMR